MKALRWIIAAGLFCIALPAIAQVDLQRLSDLVRVGRAAEAVPELQKYLGTNPKSVDAWSILGRAFIQLERLDEAATAGKQAIDLNDERPEGYIVMSRVQVLQKKNADAYATLRTGLKNKKNDPSLQTEMGFVLLAMDSLSQAVVVFTRAKDNDPKNMRAVEGLGDAYMQQNIPTMAALQYEQIIAVDSLDAEVNYKLASSYMKEKRYGEAALAYERVLSQDSTNQTAILNLAKLTFAAGQYERSAGLFKKHLERKPDDKDMLPIYMEALYLSRQFEQVLAVAERVLANDPSNVKALRRATRVSYDMKNWEKAIGYLGRLEKLDSLTLDELYQYGRSYIELKNDSLGVMQLERIIMRDPKQDRVLGEIGAGYMRMKKFDLAADAFEKRYKLDPNSTGSILNYSLSCMQLGRWEQARVALRQVTVQKPDYLPGHLNLGRCLSQMDSLKNAVPVYETVLTLGAADPEKFKMELAEAYKMIGVYNLINKAYEKALQNLNKSIQLRDDDAQTHLWKAQTLQNLNKKDEAVKEYKKVLLLDPKNKEARKGLEVLEK
ncbi:MAG: tetratricopeptide repeat protein [Ignavibacteriae bacterium]|nr:tetratricopeptide repeat protein [Ignavibacteriota bacterium]